MVAIDSTLSEFVFSTLVNATGSDFSVLGLAILFFFAGLLFISRTGLGVGVLVMLVLLDGMGCPGGAPLCDGAGAFASPIITGIMYMAYVAALGIIAYSGLRAFSAT